MPTRQTPSPFRAFVFSAETQDVAQLEETFGGRAALVYHAPQTAASGEEEYLGPADYDYGVFQEKWFYGDYDRKAAAIRSTECASEEELPTYDEEYFANYPEDSAAHYLIRDSNVLAEAYCYLPEESLEEFGCTLLPARRVCAARLLFV